MIALLGSPPKKLLERSDAASQHKWPNPVKDDSGELCRNNFEYFGGPFLSPEGKQLIFVWISALCERSVLTPNLAHRQAPP